MCCAEVIYDDMFWVRCAPEETGGLPVKDLEIY